MRLRRPALLLVPAALLLAGAGLTPAAAAPTCPDPLTRTACGGRVVAEADQSTTFHQFDNPTNLESAQRSLEAIEAISPGFLEVQTLAEWTGNADHKSSGGLPIWVVRVTDESVPQGDKKQVGVSLSVHGLESAGREGGFRYLEDLANYTKALSAATRTDRTLFAGDVGVPVSRLMRETETYVGFTNSDGWAAGDLDSTTGPGFERGNSRGKDLNRDFATVGWFDRNGGRGLAESEPEIAGWATLMRMQPNLTTSTDIHGELTTPNDAFADLIIPAGQWTPRRQEQVDQLSLRMIKTIERKFDEDGIVLSDIPFPSTGATPTKPANVAASYDIVGYDDSGFMGDWFSQRVDSVHMDIENFLSNVAPNNAFSQVLEQAHVASTRGVMESIMVEALVTESVTPTLNMKRVAYVDDPSRISSDPNVQDGNPGTGFALVAGETQVPYDVNRLEYMEVLEEAIGRPVDAVTAEQIAGGLDLSGYDSVVVSDMASGLPAGSTANRSTYYAALDAFAQAGGQLVLTDRSVLLLPAFGVLMNEDHLTINRTDAGHVDFVDSNGDGNPINDHPYDAGLVGLPSQTWYEVMLGYPSRGRAPNYGVARSAWEGLGGTTVATVGPQSGGSPNTALGTIPRGQGRITIFGSILPQAIEKLVLENGQQIETPHPFGLADYAVTITGGQVLDNVLAYDRNALAEPVVPEVPVTVLLPLLAAGLLGGGFALRRRREATA